MKGDLPPLPPSPANSRGQFDQQATVRHTPGLPVENSNSRLSHRTPQREPSDEYDEYDDDDPYVDDALANNMGRVHIDEIPDTTMLDSVILPAIASVRISTPVSVP